MSSTSGPACGSRAEARVDATTNALLVRLSSWRSASRLTRPITPTVALPMRVVEMRTEMAVAATKLPMRSATVRGLLAAGCPACSCRPRIPAWPNHADPRTWATVTRAMDDSSMASILSSISSASTYLSPSPAAAYSPGRAKVCPPRCHVLWLGAPWSRLNTLSGFSAAGRQERPPRGERRSLPGRPALGSLPPPPPRSPPSVWAPCSSGA